MTPSKASVEELVEGTLTLKNNKHGFECLNELLHRVYIKAQEDLEGVADIRTLGRLQGKLTVLKEIATFFNQS